MKLHGSERKLVLFSGDFLGPSSLSTVFEGEQMVKLFSELHVDVSVIGNHDTDFGISKMQ